MNVSRDETNESVDNYSLPSIGKTRNKLINGLNFNGKQNYGQAGIYIKDYSKN